MIVNTKKETFWTANSLKVGVDPDLEGRGQRDVIIILLHGEPGVENSFCWPCRA